MPNLRVGLTAPKAEGDQPDRLSEQRRHRHLSGVFRAPPRRARR